jgi:hypothetical protein
MFRYKPAIQFVEPYHCVVSCALNMGDLISNISVNSVSNKEIRSYFSVHFNNQLIYFWGILHNVTSMNQNQIPATSRPKSQF